MFKLKHVYDRVARKKRKRVERHKMIIKVTYGRETPYKAGEHVFVRSVATRSEEKVFTARLESDYDPTEFIRGTIEVTPVPSLGGKPRLEINPSRVETPGHEFLSGSKNRYVFGITEARNWIWGDYRDNAWNYEPPQEAQN